MACGTGHQGGRGTVWEGFCFVGSVTGSVWKWVDRASGAPPSSHITEENLVKCFCFSGGWVGGTRDSCGPGKLLAMQGQIPFLGSPASSTLYTEQA